MLNLTFLGTAAAVPSRDRAMSCIALKQGHSITLFDCAEGSQRQLMISRLSFMKIDRIFITHMHGDHMLGLPGLLQTMGMSGRKSPLSVYGPKGIKQSVLQMMDASEGEIGYELTITEVGPGDIVEFTEGCVLVFKTEHGIDSLGYLYREKDLPGTFNKQKAIDLGLVPGPDFSRLQAGETVNGVRPEEIIGPPKKGISVVYTGDTIPCEGTRTHARNADVLVHESTYCIGDEELAKSHWHTTNVQAAEIAKSCNVRALFLTHFSNRYEDLDLVRAQAQDVFENVFAVKDLDSFDISPKSIRQV